MFGCVRLYSSNEGGGGSVCDKLEELLCGGLFLFFLM